MQYTIQGPQGGATSEIPYLGYDLDALRSMEKAGYRLTIDGRRAKLPTQAELTAARRLHERSKNT